FGGVWEPGQTQGVAPTQELGRGRPLCLPLISANSMEILTNRTGGHTSKREESIAQGKRGTPEGKGLAGEIL
ncbi:MAG: hypothetical protein D3923_19170, partial [Candidatus Electrothrix sp. AR3]|nr:hypothetical protein [Candidatus Electrothrix sp. AR3]